jgi:DNA sulfur modification protein DndC
MTAMIQNDEDKEWMGPLLAFRDALDQPDHDIRDFRRMGGAVTLFNRDDKPVPGPYTQAARESWLRQLLEAQEIVRNHPKAPEPVRGIELVTEDELHEIRRIWVVEKYELEDRLPEIFETATGRRFMGRTLDDSQPFGRVEMDLLREVTGEDQMHFELVRELLEVERSYRTAGRRAKLFPRLEEAFKRGFYTDVEDATQRAVRRRALGGFVDGAVAEHGDLHGAAAALAEVLAAPSADEDEP